MVEFAEFLDTLLRLVPEIIAAGGAIAALVNLSKMVGLPDGKAPMLSLVLNFVAWAALQFAGQLGIEAEANEVLTTSGPFLAAIVALLATPVVSEWVHQRLKAANVWALGFSHTKAKA